MIFAIIFASLIPSILLYFWMKNIVRKPENESFKKACRDAMFKGCMVIFPIIMTSFLFAVFEKLVGLHNGDSLFASAFHDFIVLALAEELCKTWMCFKVLKKADYAYTWLDTIIFMTAVSLGFEIMEALLYSIGSSPGQILVRGILIMHGGYGFIEGFFYGKTAFTGNKLWAVLGFVICWIMHGAYDFGLSPDFLAVSEYSAFLSVTLALVSLIILIYMIIFFAGKKKLRYHIPILF